MAKSFDPVKPDWWRAALAARAAGTDSKVIGSNDLPIHDSKPMYGFYRMRTNKDGPFVPVAYWFDEEDVAQLRCHVNGVEQEEPAARARWHWAAKNPVSYDDYKAYTEAMTAFREDPQSNPQPKWPDEVHVNVGGKVSSSADKKKAEPAAAPAETAEPKRRSRPAKAKEEPKLRYFHQPDIRQLHSGYEHPSGTFKEIEKAEFDQFAIDYANPVEELSDELSDELDDELPVSAVAKPAVQPEPQLNAAEIAAEVKARAVKTTPVLSHNMAPSAQVSIKLVDDAPPAAGHNSGDAFGQARDEILEWRADLQRRIDAGTPKTQDEANKITDSRTKLGELLSAADKARTEETKPLRERVEAINKRWNDVIRPAETVHKAAAPVIKRFLDIERERAAERQRKLREAEEAANPPPAGQDGPRAAAPPAEEIKVSVGGRRRVSTVKRRVVKISDIKQVAAFFAGSETVNPELLDLLTKLSMKVLTAGMSVPGATLETEEGIR